MIADPVRNWYVTFNPPSEEIPLSEAQLRVDEDDFTRLGNGGGVGLRIEKSQYCIEAWIYHNTSVERTQRTTILTKRDGNANSYTVSLYGGGDTVKLYYDGYGGPNKNLLLTGTQSIPRNTWTHIAVIRYATDNTSLGRVALFVNGYLDAFGDEIAQALQTDEPLRIGWSPRTASPHENHYVGRISNLRISATASSASPYGTAGIPPGYPTSVADDTPIGSLLFNPPRSGLDGLADGTTRLLTFRSDVAYPRPGQNGNGFYDWSRAGQTTGTLEMISVSAQALTNNELIPYTIDSWNDEGFDIFNSLGVLLPTWEPPPPLLPVIRGPVELDWPLDKIWLRGGMTVDGPITIDGPITLGNQPPFFYDFLPITNSLMYTTTISSNIIGQDIIMFNLAPKYGSAWNIRAWDNPAGQGFGRLEYSLREPGQDRITKVNQRKYAPTSSGGFVLIGQRKVLATDVDFNVNYIYELANSFRIHIFNTPDSKAYSTVTATREYGDYSPKDLFTYVPNARGGIGYSGIAANHRFAEAPSTGFYAFHTTSNLVATSTSPYDENNIWWNHLETLRRGSDEDRDASYNDGSFGYPIETLFIKDEYPSVYGSTKNTKILAFQPVDQLNKWCLMFLPEDIPSVFPEGETWKNIKTIQHQKSWTEGRWGLEAFPGKLGGAFVWEDKVGDTYFLRMCTFTSNGDLRWNNNLAKGKPVGIQPSTAYDNIWNGMSNHTPIGITYDKDMNIIVTTQWYAPDDEEGCRLMTFCVSFDGEMLWKHGLTTGNYAYDIHGNNTTVDMISGDIYTVATKALPEKPYSRLVIIHRWPDGTFNTAWEYKIAGIVNPTGVGGGEGAAGLPPIPSWVQNKVNPQILTNYSSILNNSSSFIYTSIGYPSSHDDCGYVCDGVTVLNPKIGITSSGNYSHTRPLFSVVFQGIEVTESGHNITNLETYKQGYRPYIGRLNLGIGGAGSYNQSNLGFPTSVNVIQYRSGIEGAYINPYNYQIISFNVSGSISPSLSGSYGGATYLTDAYFYGARSPRNDSFTLGHLLSASVKQYRNSSSTDHLSYDQTPYIFNMPYSFGYRDYVSLHTQRNQLVGGLDFPNNYNFSVTNTFETNQERSVHSLSPYLLKPRGITSSTYIFDDDLTIDEMFASGSRFVDWRIESRLSRGGPYFLDRPPVSDTQFNGRPIQVRDLQWSGQFGTSVYNGVTYPANPVYDRDNPPAGALIAKQYANEFIPKTLFTYANWTTTQWPLVRGITNSSGGTLADSPLKWDYSQLDLQDPVGWIGFPEDYNPG